MQKEELLNMLGPHAREEFERAKLLARARGGVLSPLHLVVTLLEGLSPASEQAARTFGEAFKALSARYPLPGESITIPRDTQAVIREAGRLAVAEGGDLVTPA